MKWKWFVYIFRCKDQSYYTGLTSQPDKRWMQHVGGLGSAYTMYHPVEKLVYLEEYENLEEARLRELQIKGWTRMKKEKLINGTWSKW